MRRVLFRWQGLDIYSYPFMLYLGLVFGVLAGTVAANVAHLDSARVRLATLLLLVPALAGSRLLFVATHWHIYRREPRGIWRRSEGGAAMYGGLLLGVPLSGPLLSLLQVPFGAFWDVATFTILIGMVFTRVGCVLNGCCAGRPSSSRFALYLPNCRGIWERRLPTQLMEGGWAVLLLGGAATTWNRMPFAGALFLSVVGAYGAGRLVLESTRECQSGNARFGLQHAISAGLVVVSVAALFAGR
jgi:phosphatidylglycerol---prolipoprotein diacylglyceryl transferase